ncbi:integrase catalytic domain-containing protein [Nephila pilipes]|uniref:Integrase catalytic domain-containing protein n=1 Tax=Nephila pilipes TaxID=299642 RepID=A0A8X6IXN0_NEPPI|nr:integrase catalytic domain-containing protein [Nephila pilipes]
MIHLCSSKLAERLQLQEENVNLNVGCLSGLSITVKSKVEVLKIFRDKKTPVHCGFINENVETQLNKFFDIESIGIRDDPHCYDEDKALEIFNETVSFKNNRYTVSISRKNNCNQSGDNYYVAEKRLRSLDRRMKFDNSLYLKYRGILNEYLDKGIEKLSDTSKPLNKPVYNLPHQDVYREKSIKTKMRIVFDASSHEVGQLSLNDCLCPGINLNSNIFELLIKVEVLADIEKAFLQIALSVKDRDAVRFLFVEKIDRPIAQKFSEQVEVYRFKRLLFGVNSSPFLLVATIKLHIQKFRNLFPDVFEILDSCMYVDDLITGANDTREALKLSRGAKEIISMNSRKWVANDRNLVKELEGKKKKNYDIHPILNDSKVTKLKVLGIQWDYQDDSLSVELGDRVFETKEKILSDLFFRQPGKCMIPWDSSRHLLKDSKFCCKSYG